MSTPSSKSKRIAVIFLVALLLLVMGYWSQRKSLAPTSPKPVAQRIPKPAVLADTSAGDSSVATKGQAVRLKEPVPAPSPQKSAQARASQLTNQSNESTEPVASSPAEPAKEPVLVACDQLILRNGDLLDVKVNEIGITEIRYKKCRWLDGPDYALLKSEVLSIRFANGDIERFTGR